MMRVLFTGASSFTGSHIVRELLRRGHEVACVFRKQRQSDYTGIAGHRVAGVLEAGGKPLWDDKFGSENFQWLVCQGYYDVLCHHAAETFGRRHRDQDFDVIRAVANNTHNLKDVARLCGERTRIVITTSYAQQYGGLGEDRRAFGPYAMSKTLTTDAFRFVCEQYKVPLSLFTVANPFGRLENEDCLTTQFVKSWLAGGTPSVRTPHYVRDNIPVDLVAQAYADMLERGRSWAAPSGFVMKQGDFARLFIREMEPRLGIETTYHLDEQQDFTEPMVRQCTEPRLSRLDQKKFWDDLAQYYLEMYSR